MALELQRSVSVNCSSKLFTITDETGLYNASSNTGGYGAPNIAVADVQAAYVQVTLPDGSQYNFDVIATLPNTSDTPYTILNTDLGLSATDQFPDGLWLINYTITGIGGVASSINGQVFTYTANSYVLFDCNSQCCANENLANIQAGCGCKDTDKLLEPFILLEAAHAAVNCGKEEKATALINYLNTICGDGCGCS